MQQAKIAQKMQSKLPSSKSTEHD